jgi:hypothetical protein
MTPIPDPAITLVHIGPNGELSINTNVGNHKVIVTKSQREYDRLKGLAFYPPPAYPEDLEAEFYKPQS